MKFEDYCISLSKEINAEPKEDIARCTNCNWSGNVLECELDQEGDWESGYYDIHLCPKCEDGGCVDDYSMSEERFKEWDIWHKNKIENSQKELN